MSFFFSLPFGLKLTKDFRGAYCEDVSVYIGVIKSGMAKARQEI